VFDDPLVFLLPPEDDVCLFLFLEMGAMLGRSGKVILGAGASTILVTVFAGVAFFLFFVDPYTNWLVNCTTN